MAFPIWLLGVLLAVFASIVSNLGLNFQKRAHLNLIAAEKAKQAAEGGGGGERKTRRRRAGSTSSAYGTIRNTGSSAHNTPEKDAAGNGVGARRGSLRRNLKGGGKSGGEYSLLEPQLADDPAPTFKPNKVDDEHQNNSAPPVLGSRKGNESQVHPVSNGTMTKNSRRTMTVAPPSRTGTGSSSRWGTIKSRISTLRSDTGTLSEPRPPPKSKGNYTKEPFWILGMVCVCVGSLLDFTALAFVDQAVVAPLGSLTLVSNVFFAPLLLKEKVTRQQLYYTFLIVAGSIIAVAFAPREGGTPETVAMFENFTRARFIVYACIIAVAMCILRFACWKLRRIRLADPNGRYMKLIGIHTFAYAACAGIMGAQSVLFAKCTANLVAASIAGKGLMFIYGGTYGVLIGLGVTIFLQIRWLNSGLRMFSSLMVVPIFQSFWILVSVIAGMVFFGEYEGVFDKTANALLFPVGLLLTIAGVFMLTRIPNDDTRAEQARKRSGARPSISAAAGSTLPSASSTSQAEGEGSAISATTTATGQSAGTPLLKSAAGDEQKKKTMTGPVEVQPSLDRAVNVGSYDESEERDLLSDDVENPLDGIDEESGSSGEDGEDLPQSNTVYLAQHSMAPLNFPLFLLPASLVEPTSPRGDLDHRDTSSVGLTDIGLPYNNIFKVREESGEFDEENPNERYSTMRSGQGRNVNGGDAFANSRFNRSQQSPSPMHSAPPVVHHADASLASGVVNGTAATATATASPSPQHSPHSPTSLEPRSPGMFSPSKASSPGLDFSLVRASASNSDPFTNHDLHRDQLIIQSSNSQHHSNSTHSDDFMDGDGLDHVGMMGSTTKKNRKKKKKNVTTTDENALDESLLE